MWVVGRRGPTEGAGWGRGWREAGVFGALAGKRVLQRDGTSAPAAPSWGPAACLLPTAAAPCLCRSPSALTGRGGVPLGPGSPRRWPLLRLPGHLPPAFVLLLTCRAPLPPPPSPPPGGKVHLRGVPLRQGLSEGGPLLHLPGHLAWPRGQRQRDGLPRRPGLLAGPQPQHDGGWVGGWGEAGRAGGRADFPHPCASAFPGPTLTTLLPQSSIPPLPP